MTDEIMTEAPKAASAPPAIYAALAAARAACPGYIQKDTSAGQGRGVSHDAVTAHVRQALIDAGVLVLPSLKDCRSVDTQTRKGDPVVRFEATYAVQFVAIEDGSSVAVDVAAHGIDTGDKGPGKAYSYATKTAMLKVLSIETGEDDESRYQPPETYITEQDVATLRERCAEVGADEAAMCKAAGAETLETFPATWLEWAHRGLDRKAAKTNEAAEAGA